MTAVGPLMGLSPTDRVAVTGANGWLGREFINQLRRSNPEVPILALGSRPSTLHLQDQALVTIHPWQGTNVEEWAPTLLVHLAFLTKERQAEMLLSDFEETNRALSASALKAYGWGSIRGVVVASSGAAVLQSTEPYGALKADDEIAFARAGERFGVPTVIARAWSLSGAHCTKPRQFLLYDLIGQALSPAQELRIRADHEVWRTYADAGQYLAVCASAATRGWAGVLDSVGEVIEAGTLANRIQSVLATRKSVVRPPTVRPDDRYFSDSPSLFLRAAEAGLTLLDLDAQVARSARVFDRGRVCR